MSVLIRAISFDVVVHNAYDSTRNQIKMDIINMRYSRVMVLGPSSTIRASRWFMLEVSVMTVVNLVGSLLIGEQLSGGSPVNSGSVSTGIIIAFCAGSVIIAGYIFARLSIGPSVYVERYTPPVTLPDGGWTELVLIPPDEDETTETARIEYEGLPSTLPDLVQSSSVGDGERELETIHIDRAALDAVVTESQAIVDFCEGYGAAIMLPWNYLKYLRRESEVKTAREKLDTLATLFDTLPDRNVAYE